MADKRRSEPKPWDGTLSSNDFQFAAKEFLKFWNNHESNTNQWRWQECSQSSAQGYLILEDVVLQLSNNEDENDKEDNVEVSENSPDAATLTDFRPRYTRCTYHVTYNESYRVPNMYFRGYHSDGRSINWFDVQKSLSSQFAGRIDENKWTFLTQEEHPYLYQPWFMLHPCGTSSIMAVIFSERMKSICRGNLKERNDQSINFRASDGDLVFVIDNKSSVDDSSSWKVACLADQYLLAWVSFVGPVVRLPIPLDLFKSLN